MFYGIDFGTTNSAVAFLFGSGPAVLPIGMDGADMVRTVLFFPADRDTVFVGDNAMAEYAKGRKNGRFLQSIKSILPDPSFQNTVINGRSYSLVDLVALVLADLKKRADFLVGKNITSVVLGRPAQFSKNVEEECLAEKRLRLAAEKAGFEKIEFMVEPVAAALTYERTLREPELTLVADLGGGTSDFTVMRLRPGHDGGERSHDILATAGVHCGGDDVDAAIMHAKVIDYFGASIKYKSWDSWKTMPAHFMNAICQRALSVSVFDNRDRELLARMEGVSDDPGAVRRLQALIDDNLTFALFSAVGEAKHRLSTALDTTIRFHEPPFDLEIPLCRSELDAIVGPQVQRIERCLDEVLEKAGVTGDNIASVFITGGTSHVPCIRALFEQRFGAQKIRAREAFVSVAEGLAMHAWRQ